MAFKVIMPKLGLTMQEGTIIKWFKSEGEPVHQGEQLYEFETDKAVMQVEAKADGVVGKILAGEGVTAPVGGTVAWIVAPGEEVPEEVPEKVPDEVFDSKASDSVVAAPSAETGGRERGERLKASPVARRLAGEAGLDLTAVQGTGPGGRITKRDVEQALARAKESPPPAATSAVVVEEPTAPSGVAIPLTGLRAVIARRVAESAHTTAPVTLTTEVDAGELVAVREKLKAEEERDESESEEVSYNDLVIMIVARALRAFPFMNARLQGETIEQLAEINVGLAVDTERGLVVPVIRNADRKSLLQITQERRDLVERAHAGKATPDDLTGGTFTLTNLGMYSVDTFTPLINLPETAVMGVGRIAERPLVHQGQIVARPTLWLSLTFDHRLVDGAPAARFLQHIGRLIEQPYLCLI